eukprot:CAMPEP_0168415006 /NCGR_PEP_ID=MMETSP0228-20121227/30015_1 /TAXON_ID=133427 /ORGANISM="Protoceratium reticulatum, Strain CCCM 535 (=CCMP 1889)" /LENGTH=193 /DNA_ID=CAMNT_0008428813 /DNA_START=26 /DNA_END=604 /DNA_ORIENTATION=+
MEHIRKVAPAYVQQRWDAGRDGCGDITSCEVAFCAGQLSVRWTDGLGYRGSFQKPSRSLLQVFTEVPVLARIPRLLRPGSTVLLVRDWPSGAPGGSGSRQSNGFLGDASGKWEGESNLDEPDGVWCLRQEHKPCSTHSADAVDDDDAGGDDAEPEIVEEAEEIAVIQEDSEFARQPSTMNISLSQFRRLRLLP